jgi:hypothetical protein
MDVCYGITDRHKTLWTCEHDNVINNDLEGIKQSKPQMCIHSFINHTQQQQADCKRFLATSFGFKIEPSSGHYTRTGKQKTLQVINICDLIHQQGYAVSSSKQVQWPEHCTDPCACLFVSYWKTPFCETDLASSRHGISGYVYSDVTHICSVFQDRSPSWHSFLLYPVFGTLSSINL